MEKHDALCILPLNIVNEKIYIFLWFWLLLLGCLSTLVVAYRLGHLFLTLHQIQGVFHGPGTEKLIQARLGVSRPIYVNVESPNLGFPCFNFLGGYQ